MGRFLFITPGFLRNTFEEGGGRAVFWQTEQREKVEGDTSLFLSLLSIYEAPN